jgi:hypothetical protein
MLRTERKNLAKAVGTAVLPAKTFKKVQPNKSKIAKKPQKALSRKRAPPPQLLARSSSSNSNSKQSGSLYIPLYGKPKK